MFGIFPPKLNWNWSDIASKLEGIAVSQRAALEADLTLAKLLIGILCNCCDVDALLAVMVQGGVHHVLTYYIHMFGFNTAILAKSALTIIVSKVEKHFQRFVKLTDAELLNVQEILTASIQTKSLNVNLTDRQGLSNYYIIGFLGILQQLVVNPDNMLTLGSSVFVRLYHSILLEPELSDAAKSVLLLLKAICDHPANKKVLLQENILVTLQMFIGNETLEAKATEVIWSILSEDSLTEVEQGTKTNVVNDVKEDKIASVLKVLLTTAKFFFLKNETASQITKMEFYEVKTVFVEIFCFLRYLMALSEHFTVTVVEKCSSEIQSALKVISDYCMWMICRDKLLEKSEWSSTHPLFLFHFLFYFLVTISDDGMKQLRDSGVIDLIVKELWIIKLIPKWHKGIVQFAELILIILLKCFEVIPQGLICAGLLEQFCVEKDFLFRISAKPLLAAFSSQKSFNFKLVKLLESEALSLVNLLKTSSKDPKKVIQVASNLSDYVLLHVRYREVDFIFSNLLKDNPDNQKIFYNCCANEAVDLLATAHPSIQSRVENFIALIMNGNSSNLSVTDSNSTFYKAEVHNELLHLMCCVTSSVRIILSDQVDDNLVEQYVPFEENSLFFVGQKDLLFSNLVQLTEISTTQEGVEAFHLFLLQMPQFLILLKSLLNLSFKRIQENDSTVNVPGSSLLRLVRIFSLLQDHCQKSSEFCLIIANRGIITDLINALLILYACQNHRSLDLEWILLHMAEPILYILAVCAVNQTLHGYMQYLPKLLKLYCNVNFQGCGALAKISLSILCKSVPIAYEDFELSGQEVNFVYELLSSVIYKQENERCAWVAYTTDGNDSVYYFIMFCLHLVINSPNAIKMLKVGIMDCISFLFQHYNQEILLKAALQLLAKLSTVVKLSAESHSSMINSMQQLMQKDTMKVDAFYCLLTLGINVPKILDLSDGYIDAVAMFRVGKYYNCISKLQEIMKQSPDQIQMIQTIGESYYMLYTLKPSSTHNDQRKEHRVDSNTEHYKNAKQAIKCLGDAYDHHLFVDKDINSMHLDLAMMDCIFNVRDKPLSRCLLCRRKCGKGERLIRSHIWPEALLRHLMNGAPSSSKQVFDASWKGTGNLCGPGQIHFTMLCKACEDLFSKYEKAFKSLCFEKLYCNIDKKTKQYTITNDEIVMSTVKAPKIPKNWLYLFCLSIAFRVFIVASQGYPTHIGNFKSWYNCFTAWRELLLKEGSINHKPAPKIGLFIAPVNVLEDLSALMTKVIFSPGAGAFCNYRLHDGASTSSGKTKFLLSSIGVVNIVVSYDDTCFNFIPSECIVTLDSAEFVIPSAIRRYLLFPKGIWREYKNISAKVTERMFSIRQDKVNAPFNKAWIGEEIKIFSDVLGESFDDLNIYINFLPMPFNKDSTLQQTTATLKSLASFKIILHMLENDLEILNDMHSTFVIWNNGHPGFPELFVIFIFQNKNYVISVAYELSTVDLSIGEAMQSSSTKAFFPQVECYFEIKTLLEVYLLKAITKAGFTDKVLLAKWLKDFKSSSYCDLRCFPYCLTCIDVCSCCMRTVSLAKVIPIYYGDEILAKVAIACSSQCMSYLTSTTIMPIILYQPKKSIVSHLVLQVCTNGALFGFTDSKGKLIIHYFTSENGDTITVWCQYRLWYKQCIYTTLYDDTFNIIADHTTNTGFSELFTDDEGKGKFTQFVKDVWQFYQSLLVKPVSGDIKIMQNDQSTLQADDGFQYFAIMPVDQLSFHISHVQSEAINQDSRDHDCTTEPIPHATTK